MFDMNMYFELQLRSLPMKIKNVHTGDVFGAGSLVYTV